MAQWCPNSYLHANADLLADRAALVSEMDTEARVMAGKIWPSNGLWVQRDDSDRSTRQFPRLRILFYIVIASTLPRPGPTSGRHPDRLLGHVSFHSISCFSQIRCPDALARSRPLERSADGDLHREVLI